MEKLKDMKVKHNHTLTDILKILIFSLVMLAPFGAVLSKCLYTTFNKNAKDSYYGETINEIHYEVINNKDNLEINNKYFLDLKAISVTGDIGVNSQRIYFDIIDIKYNTSGYDLTNAHSVAFYNSNNWIYTYWYDNSNTNIATFSFINTIAVEMDIRYVSNTLLTNNILNYDILYEIQYNKNSYLDNGFYYAVNELSDQPLFSWTKDTFIYSTINQMTTGLDFGNNNVLALLLTYWILNTMIYIIFDIIIEVFKKLTHAFN